MRKAGRSDSAVTPVPPPPNSIKSTTIILSSAIAVQGVTALLLQILVWISLTGFSIGQVTDPYHFATGAARHFDASDVLSFAVFLFLQCGIAYALTRFWLNQRVVTDTTPRWLFGWTNEFANNADGRMHGQNSIFLAVVLTDMDVALPFGGVRSVAYAGIVKDLSVAADGSILRVNMKDASRFLVDMKQNIIDGQDSPPLSFFEYMTITSAHIRNVSFRKVLRLPDPSTAP
jgi:hypothetical protein